MLSKGPGRPQGPGKTKNCTWLTIWDVNDFSPVVAESHIKALTKLLKSKKFPQEHQKYRERLRVNKERLNSIDRAKVVRDYTESA